MKTQKELPASDFEIREALRHLLDEGSPSQVMVLMATTDKRRIRQILDGAKITPYERVDLRRFV